MWFKKNRPQASDTSSGQKCRRQRRPLIMALEPRMLLDGAGLATAVAVEDTTHASDEHALDHSGRTDSAGATHASQDTPSTPPAGVMPPAAPAPEQKSVVFVDARVEDTSSLLEGLAPNTDVVFLDRQTDGLSQIADYLGQHAGTTTVEIVAHGNAGDLWLGNTYLSAENIAQHADDLARVGSHIETGGDVLLYACNTAQGERGLSLVSSLARYTGRDIAASDDRTGAGSDWELEIQTGAIEAKPVLSASAEAAYQHDLATITVTSNADAGAGTLRQAISDASSGDIITFNAGMTINLSAIASGDSLLVINKSLTIDGDLNNDSTGDVTLNGQYLGRVLEISSGTVNLDGLTLTHGLLSGDGGRGAYDGGGDNVLSTGLAGGDALGSGLWISGGTVKISHSTITQNVAAGGGGGGLTMSSSKGGAGGGGGGGFNSIGGGDGGNSGPNSGTVLAGASGGSGNGGIGAYNQNGAASKKSQGGSTTGGAGGTDPSNSNYLSGGTGGTASVSGFGAVGGGGGAIGYTVYAGYSTRGGNAVGGIAVASGATAYIVSSTISQNLGAGGGASASGRFAATSGGLGVGAILVQGTLRYDAASVTISNNDGAGGGGGVGKVSSSPDTYAAASAGSSTDDILNSSGSVIQWGDLNLTISQLNADSVAWGGVGNTVNLDVGGNATIAETQFDALNSGNGNYAGTSLSVQRQGTALSTDVFGFDTSSGSPLFTVSGSNLQSAGQTFATFTNSGGVLTVSFTSSGTTATTALVQDVLRRFTYRNDTPYGDASIRVVFNDGTHDNDSIVTVTSSSIYVDNTTDTATINASNGVSISEAVAMAANASGTQTLILTSAFASQTATLAGNLAINENLTLNADNASGVTLSGSTVTVASGSTLTVSNGSGDTATIASTLAGAGTLTKTGAGTLTLSNTGNEAGMSGGITVSAGTLAVADDDALSSGTVTLASGATLEVTSTTTINNAITVSGNSTVQVDSGATGTLSGTISAGTNTVSKTGAGTLTLSGTNNTSAWQTSIAAGTLAINSNTRIGTGTVTLNGGTLNITSAATLTNAISIAADSTVQADAAVTLSGVLSGSNALTKSGTGTLTLSSISNSTGLSGGLTITAGAVSVASANRLTTGTITLNGGTFTHTNTSTETLSNNFVIGSAGGTINKSNSATLNLSGGINGSGNLNGAGSGTITHTGAGTLTLDGHTVATTGGGTFTLNSAVIIGSNGVTFNNVSTGDLILRGNLSGSGAISKTGSDYLWFYGNNTYTGTLTVNAGTFLVASTTALGSGQLTLGASTTMLFHSTTVITSTFSNNIVLAGNATIQVTASGNWNPTLSGVISESGGTRNLTVNAGTGLASITLTGANTYTGTTTINGTLVVINDATNLSAGAITFGTSNPTLQVTGSNVTLANNITFGTSGTQTIRTDNALTLSGVMSGTGSNSFTKTGTGTLTLSGTNTYTNPVTVSAGTLVAASGAVIDDTKAVTVSSGATLSLSASETIGSLAGAGNVVLGSNTTLTTGGANTSTTSSGVISGTGNLAKTGTGTFTLSGSNTYSGTTSVSGGTLSITDSTNLGSGALTLNGTTLTVTGSNITLSNAITLGASNGTVSNANALTLSGVISGSGNLTKTGAGTLTLSGSNTYSGTTTISAGALTITGDSNLGSGALSLASGTTLTISGATTVDNDIALASAVTFSIADAAAVSGVISGSSDLGKTGSGTLTLSGTNTYTGTTTVSAGGLTVAADSNLGGGALTLATGTTLDVSGNTTIDNALTLSGNATVQVDTGASATLSGALSAGTNTLSKTGAGTLTLSGTNNATAWLLQLTAGTLGIASANNLGTGTIALNGGTLSISSTLTLTNAISLTANSAASSASGTTLTLSGTVSGSGALNKTGSGTLILSGTNTYTGATTVSAGGVTLSGGSALADSVAVTVASGSTLTLSASETIGSLAGAGSVVLSSYTLTTGGDNTSTTFSGDLSGTGALTKTGSGTLTVSGTNTYTGSTTVSAGTLLVTGALNGTAGVSVASGATLGGSGSLFASNSTNTLTLASGATLAAGANGIGTLTINGNLNANGGTLAMEINGTSAGTTYDQLVINGTTDVSGATLSVSSSNSYAPYANETFTLLVNDSSDAITGNFSGLSGNTTFTLNGRTLRISYAGSSGNDIVVTEVNQTPTLTDTTISLTAVTEDAGIPSGAVGDLVSSIISSSNFNDPDGVGAGVAITGVSSNGTLWYSTNNGSTWTQLTGTVSDSSALFLYADSNTRIYFRPSADFSGAISDAITFRGWDRSDGVANGTSGQVAIALPTATGSLATGGNANRVVVSGNYAYVAASGSGLLIVDISNPASPSVVGSVDTTGSTNDVLIQGNYAYIVDGTAGANTAGLKVIDISNPASPTQVAHVIGPSGAPYRVAVSGNYAYVAEDVAGVQIINISTPTSPSSVGYFDTSGYVYGVTVSGNYLYIADAAGGLKIADISTPGSPTLIGSYDTAGTAYRVAVSGNYAYVMDGTSGVAVINISNPASPTLAGTYDTDGTASDVVISGTCAFISDRDTGIKVLDISTPGTPSLLTSYDTAGSARNIYVNGSQLYIADFNGGLQVLNWANLTGGVTLRSDTASITVNAVNDIPVVSSVGGDSASFTEGGSAVLLDAGSNGTITDVDSSDFSGGNVTVSVAGNRVATEDVLSIRNEGTGAGQISVSGTTVSYGGTAIGTFTGGSSTNDLVITLNSSANAAAVQALIHNLTYSNSNNGDINSTSRTVRITVNDGDGGTSSNADITVSITGVNDAPTSAVTGVNPTYTENGSAVDVFSSVAVSTVESGQSIDQMTLTVSNISDGSSEILAIDGSDIALTHGNSATSVTNGMTIAVSVSSGTATITISKSGGITTTAAQALVDGITYRNTSENPTAASNRVVTVTSIRDTGGTANSGSDTATPNSSSTIAITAVNDTPVLTAPTAISLTDTSAVDSFTNQTGTLSATDAEGTTLSYGITGGTTGSTTINSITYTISRTGTYGTLYLNSSTGQYVYVPNASAINALSGNSSDSFTLSASDGSLSHSQTLTINVTGANDTPILSAATAISLTDTNASDTFSNQTGTLSASDAEGATLSYGITGGTTGSTTINSVTYTISRTGTYGMLYLSSSTGQYVYVPNASVINALSGNTSESFTLSASDGSLSHSQTLTVGVTSTNDTPILSAPTTISLTDTNASDTFSSQTGTLSASDAEGTTLSYGITGGTSGSTTINSASYDISRTGSYGTLYLNSGTGQYVYVPNASAINALSGNSSDSFTLSASDGSLSHSQTLAVNVTGANDTPILSAATAISLTDTNASDTFSNQTGSLSASDAEGATLSYGITGGATGSTTINSVTYTISRTGTYGTLYLNSSTGQYVYVPNASVINALSGNTSESFTLSASDGSLSHSQTLTVGVTSTNDTPILSAPTTISLTDTNASDTFSNQTGTLSASDAEGTTLSYGITGGTSGSTTINSATYDISRNGTYGTLYLNSSTGQYVYVPSASAINALSGNTNESFTLSSSDGSLSHSQTLTVNVTGANDTPILSAPTTISLTDTNASDTFSNQTGTLSASDAEGATLSYGITGGTTGSTTINSVTYTISRTGTYGTLYLNSSTGQYVYVPNASVINALSGNTSESFTLSASDGSLSHSQTLTVGVTSTNDTPILSAPTTISLTDTNASDTFSNQTGTLSASDAEGTTLSYGITGGTSGSTTINSATYDISRNGTYGTLYLNSSTGQYVYVPNASVINALNGNTSESFTLSASDGGLSHSQTLTVGVTATNDTPILSAPTTISLTDTNASDTFSNQTGTLSASDAEGTPLSYGITGGTSGSTTINSATYDISRNGTYGTLYLNSSTGQYVYVPSASAINALSGNTNESFTLSSSDGSLSHSQTLTVNVTGANDTPILSAPTAISLTDTNASDTFSNQTGTLSASDAEGAPLSYGITGGSTGSTTINSVTYDIYRNGTYGTLYLNSSSGQYVYVPSASVINALSGNTSESFTLSSTDGNLSHSQTMTVGVTATNDTPILSAPTAISLTDTNASDTFSSQTGTLSASDAEGTPLSYGITGGSTGSTTINSASYDISRTGSYGTLYLNSGTGQYVYVPNASAINALSGNTSESFTLSSSDGSLSHSQTLAVNVTGANDTPILSTPTTISLTDTTASDTFSNQTGTLSASDAEGATLSYGITGGTTGSTTINSVTYTISRAGSYGTLYLSSSTGQYVYVPNASVINASNGNTSESFTLSASDGSLSHSQTLTVGVTATNDTPILSAPTAISLTDTNASDTFGNQTGTLSASDAEGAPLSYGITGGTSGSTTINSATYDISRNGTYGTLYLNSSTGQYVYVPSASVINALNGNNSESFALSSSDGSLSHTQTLTINVTAVNDTPLLIAPTAISLTDTAATDSFNNQTGTLSASDAESTTLSFGITGGMTGSTMLNSIIYDITRTGSYGTLYLNSSTGQYVYVPNASAINALVNATSETFDFTTSDGSALDTKTLTVNVTAVNDLPQGGSLDGDRVTFTENGSAVLLDVDSNAIFTDLDTLNFNGGNITVAILANQIASEDVLSIRNEGNSSGQIGVSGTTLTYSGISIGTFTGGSGTHALIISLNGNADTTAVQALIRNLTYSNSNTSDPTINPRTVRVTVTDDHGGSSESADITVTITGINDTPTLVSEIPAQIATEDTPFNYLVSPTHFADVDPGDHLNYTATLSNGSPLPGWLGFNANTLTFSGTPLNADVGTLTIRVTATDQSSSGVSTEFTLSVANSNDAPVSLGSTANGSGTIGRPITPIVFDRSQFIDIDAGDNLSFSAQLSSGQALPAWLHFDSNTLTLSGTPPLDNAEAGVMPLQIIATDPGGATATLGVNLTLEREVAPPPPAVVIASVSPPAMPPATPPPPVTLTLVSTVSLSGSFTLNNAESVFTPTSSTITASSAPSFTPNNDVPAPTTPTNTASFIGTVSSNSSSPEGLSVSRPVESISLAQNSAFSFQLPAGTFVHSDASANVSVEAKQANGQPLPSWLKFDPESGTFEGTPPPGYKGTLEVVVVARDSKGAEATAKVTMNVGKDKADTVEKSAPATKTRSGDDTQANREQPTLTDDALVLAFADIDLLSFTEFNDGPLDYNVEGARPFTAALDAVAHAFEREAAKLQAALSGQTG